MTDKNTEFATAAGLAEYRARSHAKLEDVPLYYSNHSYPVPEWLKTWICDTESRTAFACIEQPGIPKEAILAYLRETLDHRQQLLKHTTLSIKEKILRYLETDMDLDLDPARKMKATRKIEATELPFDQLIYVDFMSNGGDDRKVPDYLVKELVYGLADQADPAEDLMGIANGWGNWSYERFLMALLRERPNSCDVIIVIRGIGLHQDKNDAARAVQLLKDVGAMHKREDMNRWSPQSAYLQNRMQQKKIAEQSYEQAATRDTGGWEFVEKVERLQREISMHRQEINRETNPLGPVLRVLFLGPGSDAVAQ